MLLSSEPVKPRFQISGGQQKAPPLLGREGRKVALLQQVFYIPLPRSDTLPILVDKSKNTPALGESGEVSHFHHKLILDPVVAGSAWVRPRVNSPAINTCCHEKTSREGGIPPTFVNQSDLGNAAYWRASAFEFSAGSPVSTGEAATDS